MSQPVILNKFEKEKRVIQMHSEEGRTIRAIAQEVHMSFKDISKIIKSYDKKQTAKINNNDSLQTRKLLKCTKAYDLFQKGNTPVMVANILQIGFYEVRKYWSEYLRLENMKNLYNIYIDNEFNLDYLFKIYYFMLRNKIPKKDCENVLRNVDNVINLQQSISNLQIEFEEWVRVKNNRDNRPLEPLPRRNTYYTNYHF